MLTNELGLGIVGDDQVALRSVKPGMRTRWLYDALFQLDYLSREAFEWARRSLFATPLFLSQCVCHGTDIAVEQVPEISGPCRIELGSRIRFGGKIFVLTPPDGSPILSIGDGVFVGHRTTFAVARRIEIGRFTSIGAGSHIADTEAYGYYHRNRTSWDVPARDGAADEVVIEDNVQIGDSCHVLKGVRIGARSVVGAGSVVRASVPPDAVVMGNPARVVKRMAPAPPAGDAPAVQASEA